jgi:prepilin-type N-terminal cleavage/methylation domain-containing protein
MQREHLDARAAQHGDDGFTLLELMMVIAIIGILITVLAPTFLAAGSRAKDRAMQSSLRNATTGAKSFYLNKADYTTASPAALTAELGGVTFVPAGTNPSGQNSVSVQPASISQLILSGTSRSGTCFYVLDDEVAGTTMYAKSPGAGGCAANTITPTDPAWKTTW